MNLIALANHLQLSGFNASFNSYLQAVQVFSADFMAADIVKMLTDEGYNAWSEATGRVIGYTPESVIYAR